MLAATIGAFLWADGARAQIFSDGFESGDLSAWTRAKNPRGLRVSDRAAHSGGFGLEILSGAGRTGLQDSSPRDETLYVADFFLNLNDWAVREGGRLDILRLSGRGSKGFNVRLTLAQIGPDEFELRLLARDNSGAMRFAGSARLARNQWSQVSVAWARAGANRLDQGYAALFVDGELMGELVQLDNEGLAIDTARLGLWSRAGAARQGSFFVDDFHSESALSASGPIPSEIVSPADQAAASRLLNATFKTQLWRYKRDRPTIWTVTGPKTRIVFGGVFLGNIDPATAGYGDTIAAAVGDYESKVGRLGTGPPLTLADVKGLEWFTAIDTRKGPTAVRRSAQGDIYGEYYRPRTGVVVSNPLDTIAEAIDFLIAEGL